MKLRGPDGQMREVETRPLGSMVTLIEVEFIEIIGSTDGNQAFTMKLQLAGKIPAEIDSNRLAENLARVVGEAVNHAGPVDVRTHRHVDA